MTFSNIQELFKKPIDRPIDGVIKADDERHLEIELNEYVVTREVSKGLNSFCEAYLNNPTANGIWISGFFGSGKSHLLKMLSLILDSDKRVDGKRPAEFFLSKVQDEILRADLKKATSIPSRSLLFNIDQKYDGIGGAEEAAVLEVFMKVLNELQGYYGNQGYVAKFEYDLDTRGEFDGFKQTYLRVNKTNWTQDREAVATVTKRKFAKAYAEHFGGEEEDAIRVINDAKESYRLSIEGFTKRVSKYLEEQEKDFRLNFFVDEAGQFIGQKRSRLLNLQTVVESLAAATNGRASVFITSQADLEGLLGAVKFEQADSISKIQGRFKTKLSLASADVQEVIQHRLLAKNPDEPAQLIEIYERELENFKTLFRFSSDSRQLKGWQNCQSFCGLYPFHPYQLALFQDSMQTLASHSIFEGRNMAVGERSMLSVFQDVSKTIKELPLGRLASFDQLYDGISGVIRADKKQTMAIAQNQVNDKELRILKSLFLLKWVPQFKSTSRNVSILLINEVSFDIQGHEQTVKDALINLERQSYLQRNGEVYEFLTDKEKDVEQEIKRVEIGDSQVIKQIHGVIFEDVLNSTGKARYEANNNDYKIAHKIDDALIKGSEQSIAVNIVTPENPNFESQETLIARNMGGLDLMVILPDQGGLQDQIRNFLKTDLYIRQNSGSEDELLESILAARSRQNSTRRQEIQFMAEEQLKNAKLIINGNIFEAGQSEPKSRLNKAYQELIRYAYPKLSMIHGVFNEVSISKIVNEQDDLLNNSPIQLSEAENEVIVEIDRQQKGGNLITADGLVRYFECRPYGWNHWATLTFIARLYRLGKIELREKELLNDDNIVEALSNNRRLTGIEIRKQETYDLSEINALKRFHQELFGNVSSGTDARSTCKSFCNEMAEEHKRLSEILAQASTYKFLTVVKLWAEKAKVISQKENSYLLNNLNNFKEEWLEAEINILTPVKNFLNGNQKTIYDKVKNFAYSFIDEFSNSSSEKIQPIKDLLESSKPYAGGLIPKANSAMNELEKILKQDLQEAKESAEVIIDEQESQLKLDKSFLLLNTNQQEEVLKATELAKSDLQSATKPSMLWLRINRYKEKEKPLQLAMIANLLIPEDSSEGVLPKTINVVPASKIKTNCKLSQIKDSEDLDEWLNALRIAAEKELDQGNRISL